MLPASVVATRELLCARCSSCARYGTRAAMALMLSFQDTQGRTKHRGGADPSPSLRAGVQRCPHFYMSSLAVPAGARVLVVHKREQKHTREPFYSCAVHGVSCTLPTQGGCASHTRRKPPVFALACGIYPCLHLQSRT